jgi:hypothetical protein
MKNLRFVILLLVVASIFAIHAQAQVIVIANPGVKATEISKNDLRDVFTGNATSLPDGSRVVPILLKAGTVHEEFLQVYIGKNDTAYRAGWRSLVFSGQASPCPRAWILTRRWWSSPRITPALLATSARLRRMKASRCLRSSDCVTEQSRNRVLGAGRRLSSLNARP